MTIVRRLVSLLIPLTGLSCASQQGSVRTEQLHSLQQQVAALGAQLEQNTPQIGLVNIRDGWLTVALTILVGGFVLWRMLLHWKRSRQGRFLADK